MKILVCTDGSEQSKKAMEQALVIAQGCNVHEVAVIHVYDEGLDFTKTPFQEGKAPTKDDLEQFNKIQEDHKNERKNDLQKAVKYFEDNNLHVRGIFKEGHPSHIIVETASEEGFDMIVIGSRGIGGFKKVFLGSVSSAVVQEAKDCSVTIVK